MLFCRLSSLSDLLIHPPNASASFKRTRSCGPPSCWTAEPVRGLHQASSSYADSFAGPYADVSDPDTYLDLKTSNASLEVLRFLGIHGQKLT